MHLDTIKQTIENTLNNKYNIKTIIKHNDKNKLFDFYLALFVYQKTLQKDILEIFNTFKADLMSLSEIEDIFFDKGFLNIKINRYLISKKVLTDVCESGANYGQLKPNNQTIVIDYSSPNIAKNFSIGHLRSTVIGNSLKNIYNKLGYQIVGINHLGDWGTQFGKMILAFQKWGKKELVLKDPINELQKLYIYFHEQAETDEQLNQDAREIFKKLEEKDPEIVALWKWFKDISLTEFRKIYDLLNISFDHYIGESFYHDKSMALVEDLRTKNLLLLDQKAYIMPLEGIPPALIQKDNGSTLYLTRDMACVLYRKERFNFQKTLYVVGNEQKLHYQQLKQAMDKIMGYDCDLEHVNFGLVLFENAKISTRKSNNYRLIDILEATTKEAEKTIQEKNHNLTNIHEKAKKIAIGAVVFNDLKNDRHLNIEFNLKHMLQFEGNTGPYLQYTIARLNSVIKQLKKSDDSVEKKWVQMKAYFAQDHYFALIKLMDQFSSVLEKAKKDNMPSILARYLLKLAKTINQFYTLEKILTDDLVLQTANGLLIKTVSTVLKEGLNILGIPLLEQM
ncbi:arginine--tRNA ligase [Vaccinium witches'-broom phytoplasma]|uniref:arginine--tRNA ligase n=1 Tax=Vaccinium witches'-broom phytoplasma TaxID=85642 RepID=UPI000381BB0A|nr:arginine--tRNA ligase [Vaccinium witches'-broom phytoplasma]